jgi:hypothetical protein
MPILPGRPRSDWVITDAHGGNTSALLDLVEEPLDQVT